VLSAVRHLTSDARVDARGFLRKTLACGEQRAASVLAEARSQNLSERTLRRAFRDLGGHARKAGFGAGAAWMWRLPSEAKPDPPAPTIGTQPFASLPGHRLDPCQLCHRIRDVALVEVAPKTAIDLCQECYETGKAAAWAGSTGS